MSVAAEFPISRASALDISRSRAENEIRRGRGVVRGTEDFVLVLFEGLDPGTHVCGMIRGIVRDLRLRQR